MKKYNALQVTVVAILVLSILAAAAQAMRLPDEIVYGIDEQILWEQGLFFHFNCIPIALEWPASLFSMMLYALSWVSVCVDTAFLKALCTANLSEAHTILNQHVYIMMHDFSGVVWGRLVLVGAKLLTLVAIYKLMKSAGVLQRSFVLVSMAVSIALFKITAVLHPDSLAVYIWSLIYLFIQTRFNNQNLKHHWALMLAVVVLCTTKITYGIVVPVLLVYFLTQLTDQKARLRVLAIWTAGFTGAFVVACPWAVTGPLTFLKAILSNLMEQSGSEGNSVFVYLFEYLPQSAGVIGLICFIPGIVSGIRSKTPLVWVSVVLLLIFSLPVMMASQTHLRYAMPVLPILIWCAGLGFQQLMSRYTQWALIVLVLIALLPVWDMITVVQRWHQPTNKMNCVRWVQAHIQPNQLIEADASLIGYLDENETSLTQCLTDLNDPERYRLRLNGLFKRRGLSQMPTFTESELQLFQDRFHEEYAFNRQKLRLKLSNLNTLQTPKYNLVFVSKQPERWPPFVRDTLDLTLSPQLIISTTLLDSLMLLQQFDQAMGPGYFVYSK